MYLTSFHIINYHLKINIGKKWSKFTFLFYSSDVITRQSLCKSNAAFRQIHKQMVNLYRHIFCKLYFYIPLAKPSVTMPRGRSAASARSESSEMDVDGTGSIAFVIIINNKMLMLCLALPVAWMNSNNAITLFICCVWAESEIAKLQRQFRIMEGDRQAYNIQAREQIRKQQWISFVLTLHCQQCVFSFIWWAVCVLKGRK